MPIINRFSKAFIAVILALLLITTLALMHEPSRAYLDPWTGDLFAPGGVEKDLKKPSHFPIGSEVSGGVIMPKLANATAKAELGRATWKLMHTMTLRFPENPDEDERIALKSFFHLTSRLYPCGECATEFQGLLKKFPPQTSSRKSAALWLCFVHNQVNERLEKPEFDCAHLDATYDCGCGDAPIASVAAPAVGWELEKDEKNPTKDDFTGAGLIKGGR